MEEKEVVQKELFREFSQTTKRPGRFAWFKKPVSFRPLIFIFSYEKFIFLIIVLLIILAVIFSLGVEQGRRTAPVGEVKALSTKAKTNYKDVHIKKR